VAYTYPLQKTILPSGIQLAYRETGPSSAAVVLMIHGLGSNHAAFHKLTAELEGHRRCISVDLPGYGASSCGDYPFSMGFFAAVILEFMDSLQIWQATLAGHSMGGQIAMHLARRWPARIRDLVLLCPAGFERFHVHEAQWFERVYDLRLMEQLPVSQIVQNFHLNFYRFPADAQFMIDDRLRLREQSSAYRYFCRMVKTCVLSMLQEPVHEWLEEITLPTLIVFGVNDMLIPNRVLHPQQTTRQLAQASAMRMPRAELLLLPQCGHFPQWEHARRVGTEMHNFWG
jgi:pimeloyl-ACP methyl ester carboxylesterase